MCPPDCAKSSWHAELVLLVSPDTTRLRRVFSMYRTVACLFSTLLLGSVLLAGCETPNHTAEAPWWAAWAGPASARSIGHASGHAGAGAAIGAVAGGLTGAAIGASARQCRRPKSGRDRRRLAARRNRHPLRGHRHDPAPRRRRRDHQPSPRQSHGRPAARRRRDSAPQFGVSNEVIKAMQESPPVPRGVVVEGPPPPPPPVVVEGYYGPGLITGRTATTTDFCCGSTCRVGQA